MSKKKLSRLLRLPLILLMLLMTLAPTVFAAEGDESTHEETTTVTEDGGHDEPQPELISAEGSDEMVAMGVTLGLIALVLIVIAVVAIIGAAGLGVIGLGYWQASSEEG